LTFERVGSQKYCKNSHNLQKLRPCYRSRFSAIFEGFLVCTMFIVHTIAGAQPVLKMCCPDAYCQPRKTARSTICCRIAGRHCSHSICTVKVCCPRAYRLRFLNVVIGVRCQRFAFSLRNRIYINFDIVEQRRLNAVTLLVARRCSQFDVVIGRHPTQPDFVQSI
jgi:hypothetical protein